MIGVYWKRLNDNITNRCRNIVLVLYNFRGIHISIRYMIFKLTDAEKLNYTHGISK